jgi:hypothetical protein
LCPSITIGNFVHSDAKNALSHIRLVLPVNDFLLDTRRYNLVSNYIAEYSSYHFEHKDRAENLISSVFYELLEYLVSSSHGSSKVDIRFSTSEEWLIFELSCKISSDELMQFKELLTEINQKDLESYYRAILESDDAATSLQRKMGMVMIAHDYHARVTATLDEDEGSTFLQAFVRQEEINT